MISKKIGLVESIISKSDVLEEVTVNINGEIQKSYNYPNLTGNINVGDEVLLNTTAVELSLGTGGYHFVIANLSKLESSMTPGGHIMKLRYTPMQIKVNSVEEQDSELHDKINSFKNLDNLPVVVGTLHSMITPFVASYKRNNPNKKIVYIMTDGAALPIYLSKNIENLKNKGLVNKTITIGNAFGGDYECINIYSALITAKEILNADVVFVSMGPGIAGTGTKYGFTGIEQGPILDAVHKLGGNPIAIPRISFADKRDRHNGISHHSLTVLKEIVNVKTNIPIGINDDKKLLYIKNQIEENKLSEKHNIIYIKNLDKAEDDLKHYGLKVKSMGRNYEQDKEFFDASSNAAYYLMEVCDDNRRTNNK
ncbi:MAG: DUF3866 family protein [Paraclostridium sp.]